MRFRGGVRYCLRPTVPQKGFAAQQQSQVVMKTMMDSFGICTRVVINWYRYSDYDNISQIVHDEHYIILSVNYHAGTHRIVVLYKRFRFVLP